MAFEGGGERPASVGGVDEWLDGLGLAAGDGERGGDLRGHFVDGGAVLVDVGGLAVLAEQAGDEGLGLFPSLGVGELACLAEELGGVALSASWR